MTRYIPRIEGLEQRELLDATVLQAVLPPPQALTVELETLPTLAASDDPYVPALHGESESTALTGTDSAARLSPQTSAESVQFLQRYARKAIRNEELRYGLLPDHDDIVHQVYLEWWERVGTGDGALANLLHRDSAERETLRKTVRRVIDHVRYEHNRSRGVVDVSGQSFSQDATEAEWLDFRIDVDTGVGGLSTREKTVLMLRGEGKTVEEIGSELGMAKQRVSEVCQHAISSLRRIYESPAFEVTVR